MNLQAVLPFPASEIQLRHLQGEAAISTVQHLRDEIDLSAHSSAGRDLIALDKKRDACGFVCGFEYRDQVIGTVRMVPIGLRLTLTEALLATMGEALPATDGAAWEVGRLVLAPEYRGNIEALRHCLKMALGHASEFARVDSLYASCTHVLSRLYRRFGFSVLAKDVPLPGTSKVYTLIRGAPAGITAVMASAAGY